MGVESITTIGICPVGIGINGNGFQPSGSNVVMVGSCTLRYIVRPDTDVMRSGIKCQFYDIAFTSIIGLYRQAFMAE